MTEEWREVANTDGMYEVSNLGRVRTWKNGKWGRATQPRIMLPGPDGHVGHVAVNLCLGTTRRRGKVHRLVAEAFLGDIPEGMEVRHLDGNPKNNRADNLAFGTRRENMADALRHGTVRHGSGKSCAKLTELDIPIIRAMAASGYLHREIAERFGVTREAIGCVVRGVSWRHVS